MGKSTTGPGGLGAGPGVCKSATGPGGAGAGPGVRKTATGPGIFGAGAGVCKSAIGPGGVGARPGVRGPGGLIGAICFQYPLQNLIFEIHGYIGEKVPVFLAWDDRGRTTNESILTSTSRINLSTIAVSDKKTTIALLMREADLMFFPPPTTSHIANKTYSTVVKSV